MPRWVEQVPEPGSGFLAPRCAAPALRALKTLPEPSAMVAEVAATLGVCGTTIYKLCERGELAYVRVSNAIRFEPLAAEPLECVDGCSSSASPSKAVAWRP
jgi:excisionase family DNA binding protein